MGLSDIDSIMEASSQNDPFAQAFLALVYVHGDKNRQIDYDKAYKLAVLSSEGIIGWAFRTWLFIS